MAGVVDAADIEETSSRKNRMVDGSSGRPAERTFSEQVDVEMGNRLAAEWAVVDDDSKTLIQLELACEGSCGEHQLAQQGLIVSSRLREPWNGLLGDDQHMDGSLWVDVMQGDAIVILVGDFGRYFPVDDLRE